IFADAAAVSCARAGEWAVLLAGVGVPDAIAGAIRARDGGGDDARFPHYAVFWRADDVCAAAGDVGRCGDRDWWEDAVVCFRFGAAAGAGAGGISRTLWACDFGALWDDGNVDESFKSV